MGYCSINGQTNKRGKLLVMYVCPVPKDLYTKCEEMGCEIYEEWKRRKATAGMPELGKRRCKSSHREEGGED
jgi:hypothetical protein